MRDSPRNPDQAFPTSVAPDLKRRRALLAMTAGGLGAVAAASQGIAALPVATVPSSPDATTGYRETDHVKRYYDSTRL